MSTGHKPVVNMGGRSVKYFISIVETAVHRLSAMMSGGD
jgi:hypothetical protein